MTTRATARTPTRRPPATGADAGGRDRATAVERVTGSDELSVTAATLILDPDNQVFLSSVSTWEMVVKVRLGKLRLPDRVDRLVPEMRGAYDIDSLALEEEATLQLDRLPDLHRDPFDRILLCQSIAHGLTFVTPDETIGKRFATSSGTESARPGRSTRPRRGRSSTLSRTGGSTLCRAKKD